MLGYIYGVSSRELLVDTINVLVSTCQSLVIYLLVPLFFLSSLSIICLSKSAEITSADHMPIDWRCIHTHVLMLYLHNSFID